MEGAMEEDGGKMEGRWRDGGTLEGWRNNGGMEGQWRDGGTLEGME